MRAFRASIDHGLLSPSGHVSKRARKAALDREGARLFPVGTFTHAPKTDQEKAAERAQSLRQSAANLRALASRGMSPRKYAKEADKLEAEALTLESED